MSEPTKKARPPFIRKIYLVNRPFQIRFIRFLFALSMMSSVISYFSNMWFFWKFKNLGVTFGLPADHVFFHYLAQQEATMNKIFIFSVLFIFLTIVTSGILYSHRIAGSLGRLNKHLQKLADGGELSEVRFRKDDFFQDVAESFNRFVRANQKSR